ncbi:hypothetical protein HPB50_020326 [Hyalomma asiaticum]|uniref:Uncharacterized protein n=1 Tax=Hyalomma asiaticum TaxID=266040 RepID=A0ACB7S1S4_HYAAI|nr:hypothetical protein HPB50_020326 [Hyalomma asiaticum]
MSAADSAQRSDVPQQATNVLKPATLVLNAAANGSAPSANMDDAGESEAKKLRVDEDKTSTYDLSEDEDIDCDETPFTLVSYKKKRPEGIPVVFRPSEEGSNFWQVNPNRAASEIVAAAKEKVQSFRVNRDGSFSVNVASLSSARHLLSMSEVAGLGVKTSIPASYTRNVGKIRHVPVQYTEDQLVDFLKEFGVTSARRQARFNRQEDGSVNIAASKLRRHELIYGRLPPHNAPSPNPDTVRYAPSISNQEQEQRDKRSYSATLKRPGRQGPITERHDQSTGNAAHCAQTSHESGRSAQQQPVPLHQQPHLTPHQRRQHSPQQNQSSQRTPQAALRQPATTAPGASASTSDYAPVPMAHVLLPMLFTALRAILSAIPQANNLPEVKALLSMESLVIPQPPSDLQ